MKKSSSAILLILMFIQNAFACDCIPKRLEELQNIELENSECIFVGEIIEINKDLTYKIRVVESLDGGDLQGNVYIGENWKSCQPYVEEKGFWLVYGQTENGFLKMNICGISRSFDKPQAPPSNFDLDIFEVNPETVEEGFYEEYYDAFWKRQRLDLANEIAALRKRRDELTKKSSGLN